MQALLQAYEDMPPITRAYTTACVLTTLAVVRFLSRISGCFSTIIETEVCLSKRGHF